jgi:hypothetical protein
MNWFRSQPMTDFLSPDLIVFRRPCLVATFQRQSNDEWAGLLTRIATESVVLCADEKLTAFLELQFFRRNENR